MIVSKKLKTGFAFIRHTATRSIEHALLGSGAWSRVPGQRHRAKVPEKFRSYSWHVVVRNPYYQVWSEYRYFKQRKNNSKGRAMADRVKKMSFPRFVEDILMAGEGKVISSTQSRLCSILQPDVVLRFEQIPDCLYRLPWWPRGLQLPHVNQVIGNSLRGADRRGLELVREWAKEDFERFGYSDELPD